LQAFICSPTCSAFLHHHATTRSNPLHARRSIACSQRLQRVCCYLSQQVCRFKRGLLAHFNKFNELKGLQPIQSSTWQAASVASRSSGQFCWRHSGVVCPSGARYKAQVDPTVDDVKKLPRGTASCTGATYSSLALFDAL
jgi:hypothetical protein